MFTQRGVKWHSDPFYAVRIELVMDISFKDKSVIQSVLMNEETPTTVLLVLIVDRYGLEALEWDPMALANQLVEDFDVSPPQITFDKLNAGVALLTTDRFYNDWEVFNSIANALNDDTVDFEILDMVTPEEAAWAITEASLLEDPDTRPAFGEELRRFLGVMLKENGLIRPPDVLKLADIPMDPEEPDTSLSDDPVMFGGWENKQAADAEDVVNYIKDRMRALIESLDALPVKGRDVDTWGRFKQRATHALRG